MSKELLKWGVDIGLSSKDIEIKEAAEDFNYTYLIKVQMILLMKRWRKTVGISSNEFYINSISVSIKQDDSKKILSYSDGQINEELLNSLKFSLDRGMLYRLEMSNTETDLSMSLFCENGISYFGIVDIFNDINYYYDDGSVNTNLIPINGQVFEKWMVCEDNALLWEAVLFFAHHGERSLKVNWRQE